MPPGVAVRLTRPKRAHDGSYLLAAPPRPALVASSDWSGTPSAAIENSDGSSYCAEEESTEIPFGGEDEAEAALNGVIAERAYYEGRPDFLADVLARATRDGWTPDDVFVEQARLAMEDRVEIQRGSSDTESGYRWRVKPGPAPAPDGWSMLFPHKGDDSSLTERFAFAANALLEAAERLVAAEDPMAQTASQPWTSSVPLWKRACAETRYLVRHYSFMSTRPHPCGAPGTPAGVPTSLEQPKPDVFVVAKHVFERMRTGGKASVTIPQGAARASGTPSASEKGTKAPAPSTKGKSKADLFWDEVIVLEAKTTSAPQPVQHALSSSMLKTSIIKASTLSNGDMWFAVLAGSLLYFGWVNGGVIVRHGPVDATMDPNLFLRAIIMLASKGLTLTPPAVEVPADSSHGSLGELEALSLATGEVTGAPASLHAAREDRAQRILLAQPLARRMRSCLEKGGHIPFRLLDTSMASSTTSGEWAVVEFDADITSDDIRCSGGSRGLQYRPVGKHTDVFIAKARLITSHKRTAWGGHALKTSSCRDRHIGREVRNLNRLRKLYGLNRHVKKRLPKVLAFGELALAETDPVSTLRRDAQSLQRAQPGPPDSAAAYADPMTADALRAMRRTFLTLYEEETFELQGLEPRHFLAVLSDAACMLAHCWHKASFVHRDISDSNIASRLSPKQLQKCDAQIREVLQGRLAMLKSAERETTPREAWWEKWARDESEAASLCVILDPENATFFGENRASLEEEKESNFSGTPLYQTQLHILARYHSHFRLSHHTADDIESLLLVCLGLLSALEQDHKHGDAAVRGFKALKKEDVERIARGDQEVFFNRVSAPDLLGPGHWALGGLLDWRNMHQDFYMDRTQFLDDKFPLGDGLRDAMFASPQIKKALDELLLGAATEVTRLAVVAYERWQAESGGRG